MNIEGLEPDAQKWVTHFNQIISDPVSRENFINNPAEIFNDFDLAVDANQKDAVMRGLQSVALAHDFGNRSSAKSFSTKLSKNLASDFEKYFHWNIYIWGCELRIDHEAIKQLPGPVDASGILAGTTFAVVKAAGAIGPNAVVIALGLAYWGAIFTAYVITLPLLYKGKGVHLSVTGPQFGVAVASGGLLAFAALPVPTTVL